MEKNKTPEEMLQVACSEIKREIEHWNYLRDYGCQDPFWPDGCNMNLTRNHIISYRREIVEICEQNGLELPTEYYLPVPPQVPEEYMANMDQKERVERLKITNEKLVQRHIEYDDKQLRLC